MNKRWRPLSTTLPTPGVSSCPTLHQQPLNAGCGFLRNHLRSVPMQQPPHTATLGATETVFDGQRSSYGRYGTTTQKSPTRSGLVRGLMQGGAAVAFVCMHWRLTRAAAACNVRECCMLVLGGVADW
jgi:hypothetical protein